MTFITMANIYIFLSQFSGMTLNRMRCYLDNYSPPMILSLITVSRTVLLMM